MKRQVWKWIGLVLLFAASAFGIWKTIYLSADIDESYAVTLGIRLISGDRLFRDMWEVHQTSAVLYAPFLALYKGLTNGTEGILVYLRIVGILIQGAVSVYGFFVMKKWVSPAFAIFLSLLYFNFTPKQIQSPEFTQFLYWGIMMLGLSLLEYVRCRKKTTLVAAALSLCVCVLAYPYGVVLFPLCIGILLSQNKDTKKEKIQTISIFSGVCVLMAAMFLFYVLRGVSFGAFLENLSCVFLDESHEQSMKEMWLGHLQTLGEMLIPTFLVILLLQLVLRSKKNTSDKKRNATLCAASVFQAGLFLYQFHTIEKVNFTILLPLILQLAVFLLYVYWILTREEQGGVADTDEFRILVAMGLPSLTGFAIVLSSSNLSANYSTGFLLPCVLGFLMVLERKTRDKGKGCVAAGLFLLAGVFAVMLFATRIFLVRFTSTQRKNLFEGYYETNHGPLRGIRLGETDYRQYEAKTQLLKSLVTEEDVFLYVGCDLFLYSQFEGRIGTGNTISTPVFGEQLLTYYEKYPDKIPDILFVDREYVADFGLVLCEEPFASFVADNYEQDTSVEGAPVDVYRRVQK